MAKQDVQEGVSPKAKAKLTKADSTSKAPLVAETKPVSKAEVSPLQNKEYLEKLWHTTAHVFASALTEMYPSALIAIGPPIEAGFHYDFELDKKINEEDLAKLEVKMKEVLSRKDKMVR